MLELKDVVAGYGDKQVLNGVSLKLERSEIVGLVGPNGSGKSTVLKSIFGMLKVSEGSVLYKGKEIKNRKTALNALDGISYIPQGSKVFSKLTVQENLEMGGVLLKKREVLLERVEAMYERFPKLKEYKNTPSGKLSGGERQMVGFCRGLIMNPEMLLVDEPSIGLSPTMVKQTMDLISEIREKMEVTILVVEQNVGAMLKIADRVYLLSMGKVIYREDSIDEGTQARLGEYFLK